MQEAWIELECPSCGELWEAKLDDLPGPEGEHECQNCGDRRPMVELAQTERELEILESFHQG